MYSNVSHKQRHDKFAPYWAVAFIVLAGTGLATIWIDLGPFWKGYVLDITGPAWNYILFRGLFTSKRDNAWTRFFTPVITLSVFLVVCAGIEGVQYLELYDATYDPLDFLAYVSFLIPLFVIDLYQTRKDPGETENPNHLKDNLK